MAHLHGGGSGGLALLSAGQWLEACSGGKSIEVRCIAKGHRDAEETHQHVVEAGKEQQAEDALRDHEGALVQIEQPSTTQTSQQLALVVQPSLCPCDRLCEAIKWREQHADAVGVRLYADCDQPEGEHVGVQNIVEGVDDRAENAAHVQDAQGAGGGPTHEAERGDTARALLNVVLERRHSLLAIELGCNHCVTAQLLGLLLQRRLHRWVCQRLLRRHDSERRLAGAPLAAWRAIKAVQHRDGNRLRHGAQGGRDRCVATPPDAT
mmetsp:Transcript_60103/g.132140  ORF Transcript_60103/g.132140 Transcript_60103/m.132140 type:complete len:265 (+) Transcript_60103:303-1097(+)